MNAYWKERFNWSNSKQNLWEDCKKAFYFDTIAKWEYEPRTKEKDEIWWLAKLVPQNALLGNILHDTLKQQLTQHQVGRPVNQESARAFFQRQLDEYAKNADKTIIEAINGQNIDVAFFEKVRREGLAQLDNFFTINWPIYSKLEYLKHEDFDELNVDGVRVVVKIDLATKSPDGQIVITDWKTGQEDSDIRENLQLGVYILWATSYYNVPPERIKAELVYLKTGRVDATSRTAQQLKAVSALIKANGQEMLAIESPDQLPPSPEKFKCIGCKYMTACSEGVSFATSHKNLFRV